MAALAALAVMTAGAGQGAESGLDGKAAWETWRQNFEEGYFKDRLAVLKINDAVFLRPGQTGYLRGREGEPSSYRWSPAPSGAAVLRVAFRMKPDGRPGAQLVRGGRRLDALRVLHARRPYAVTGRIDLTGRVVGEGTGDSRLELKIYNQDHPAAAEFSSLDFFPWSARWRIEARFRPEAEPAPVILETERGLRKRFYRHGHARFEADGETVRMPLYTQSAETDGITGLFAPFTDETTGKETYGVGRYLDIPVIGAWPPETVLIDFNRAYNPLCARSDHFNCPLVEFHIPAAVRAGERHSNP